MVGLPEITLVGILVTDPELRITPTGAVVATFTVAAHDRRYDPTTGHWIDKGATLLPCSLWRHAAENVAESLTTGTRVLVTGVLRQREWDTTGGDKRYAYELDATEVGVSLTGVTVRITKATRDTTSDSGIRWDDDTAL
jgi:single-strand DNA-binding protein